MRARHIVGGMLLAPFVVLGTITLIGSFLQQPLIFILAFSAIVGGWLLLAGDL